MVPCQECLELVRQQRQPEALMYARKHFPPFSKDHFPELRRAMAAIAFGADTTCSRYAELFDPARWDLLVELFQKDLFQMNFLTSRSMLDLHMQVSCPGCTLGRLPDDAGISLVAAVTAASSFKEALRTAYIARVEFALLCNSESSRYVKARIRWERALGVQAGLSSLKTPHSLTVHASKDNPFSSQVCPTECLTRRAHWCLTPL